jgi:hypothetical protein
MTTSIGDGLFLWFQFSMNGNDFITNIELGHKDKNSPHYKDEFDMEKAKFEAVTHSKTKLIFWVKRDLQKIKAFGDLRVSHLIIIIIFSCQIILLVLIFFPY